MDSKEEAALVDVILEEVKAQRYTATEMQARTGIKSRSWQNYFRQRTRPIPIKAVYAIADVLGLSGSELMRRAEERAAHAGPSSLDPTAAPGVNVAKILRDSPHLEAVREEGQRLIREGRATTGE